LNAFLSFPGKLSRLARRQALLFIAAIVLIGIVLAGGTWLADFLHDRQIGESAENAKTVSFVLAQELDQSLQSVSSSLSRVVERLQSAKPASAGDLNALATNRQVGAFVQEQATPRIEGIAIAGADEGASVEQRASRAFMGRLRSAHPDDVLVSSPLESTTSSKGIEISKRVSSPTGAFLGAVTATLKQEAIGDLLQRFIVGKHGSIALYRTDGAMMTRVPAVDFMLGKDITKTPVYTQFVSVGRDGVTQSASAIDGVNRIFSIAKLPHFPLSTVVTVATSDALANWQTQSHWIASGAFVLVILIAAGAVKLAINVDHISESRESAAVQQQLAIQYKQFNNAMDNIVQGVALFDAKMKLITCNRRYAEIYGLPAEMTLPGAANAEVLFQNRNADGDGYWSAESRTETDGGIIIVNELSDGRTILQRKKKLADGGWVSTHEDITARRRAEEKVREMATKDPLTGLSNRFEFRQRLDQCIAEVRRKVGKFAVFYLDLDQFKAVNDSLGHPFGDKLLQEVAARIAAEVRSGDTIARLGGDEFAIIQRIENTLNDPVQLAQRVIASVSEPYMIDGNTIVIGASIGISMTPNDSLVADELIRGADMALYQSKAQGRGNYNFFKTSMDEQIRARRQMEDDLRAAIAGDQFSLHFQPVVCASERNVKSFEALLRWEHPVKGNIPPGEFISLAEEVGLIVPIGEWVIREACKEAAKWPREIKVGVNVSAVQFKSAGLIQAISAAIKASGIDSSRLIVEVTESVMIGDTSQAIAVLHSIRDLNILIAMDDFGTGYSSLSYLHRFPFDKIKIDRSFVRELGERQDSVAIVRAITSLAKALGMATVAEGVETEDQFACLETLGCDEIQGFLISRPMPAAEVLNFLAAGPEEQPAISVAEPASGETPAKGEPTRAPSSVVWSGSARNAKRARTSNPRWRLLG
jgi:diguanylate cyclase (GGDEF)-like protein